MMVPRAARLAWSYQMHCITAALDLDASKKNFDALGCLGELCTGGVKHYRLCAGVAIPVVVAIAVANVAVTCMGVTFASDETFLPIQGPIK